MVTPDWLRAMYSAHDTRTRMLALASKLAEDGAHYLWGADALKPGADALGAFAAVKLDLRHLDQTTFCAATCSALDVQLQRRRFVCAGRCSHEQYIGARHPASGVVADSAHDEELATFTKRFAGKSAKETTEAQTGWTSRLTPRVVEGDRITDYARGKTELVGRVVWGEACTNRLHFDCGSFVRHVVKEVCHVDITGITRADLSKMRNPWGGRMATEVMPGDLMMPTDILVYDGHVAFATRDGEYQRGHYYFVSQAESAVYGVNHDKKTHTQISTKCIRLTDSTLLGAMSWVPGDLRLQLRDGSTIRSNMPSP